MRAKPFQPGQVANPAGRPKGVRNKIQTTFLKDLLEAWERDGKAALKVAAKEEPMKFVQVVASLMPKDVVLDGTGELSDEELALMIDDMRERRAKLIEQRPLLESRIDGNGAAVGANRN